MVLHMLKSKHYAGYDSCDARSDGAPQVSVAALHHDAGRQLLLVSCGNAIIMQWDFTGMQQQGTPPVQKRTMMIADDSDKKVEITAMAFDSQNQWLFANHKKNGGYGNSDPDRVIMRWFTGLVTPEALHGLVDVGHIGGVKSLAVDTTTYTLYSGSASIELIEWDTQRNATMSLGYSQTTGADCDDKIIDNDCSRGTSAVQFLQLIDGKDLLFSSDSRGNTVIWDTSVTPPNPTDHVACAVEALPAPAVSLRVHDWLTRSGSC